MPVIALKAVVLPAPLGPMRPRISPSYRVKLTSSSATTPPKRSVTFLTSSRALRVGSGTDDRLLLPVLEFGGPGPVGPETLGPEDHHHDEDDTEDEDPQAGRTDVE